MSKRHIGLPGNLKQQVESAPFLLEHGITEFVERDKEIKAQTEMEGV
jgi:hypothetical protein